MPPVAIISFGDRQLMGGVRELLGSRVLGDSAVLYDASMPLGDTHPKSRMTTVHLLLILEVQVVQVLRGRWPHCPLLFSCWAGSE